MESILEDEDVMDECVADKLKKRKQDDADKDEGPSAGSDRGLMRQKTSKSQPKSSGKSAQADEIVFETRDTQEPQNQGQDIAITDRLDWNNPKRKEYPFDLRKPLPLIMEQGRQVVPVDYFINNDLEYLRRGRSRKKYTTFTTKTKAAKSDISKRIPYTAYNNLQVIIYEDKYKRNRLICMDELYNFSDGTLTSVRTVLHDIASNRRMYYLPKKRWTSLDKKRSRVMIKVIDQQLLERRLMRSLERFVGGRDYKEDLRLLERTI
ncbi:hypothetical protein Tco_1281698 [Tanacetum coccineum]